MPEIIQDWLGTRLGVLLDLSPQKFARNTKDGKLLAKLLYSYGVIPLQILEKMKDCNTCYDCYDNLSVLKPWLTYIGVTHDDSILRKMAGGEGSAAVSLFYSVYLNLERKDRLHYFTVQKQRRSTDDSCIRFKVDWVPEKALQKDSDEMDDVLAVPLVEFSDMVQLHKAKCKEAIDKIKRAKKKFQKLLKKEEKLRPVISKSVTSQPLDKRKMEADTTIEEINKFSEKHPQPCGDFNYNQLMEMKKKYETCPLPGVNMSEKARTIIGNIKRRKKGEIYAQNFQQKMQQVLLDEQWQQIVERQDKNFEDTVCANLLKQSQYEKQMVSKLNLIKHQKKVMTENRRKLECLKIERRQKEFDDLVQARMELRGEFYDEEEFEKERIAELHRRLYDAKAQKRRNLLLKESRNICQSLVDIAIRISEIRELTGCQIPKSFMKDLKELFFKNLSIFDLLDHFEEIYEDNNDQIMVDTECFGEDVEGEFVPVDSSYERLKLREMERQSVLDECDLRDYLDLLGPWMVELLFPDYSEVEGKHLVLGYIVHKLLGMKYPALKPSSLVELKPMNPTAIVQGLDDDRALTMLTDLMELCKILVVKVEDAINFVLLAYKEALSEVRHIDLNFQKITLGALNGASIAKEKEKRKLQLLKKVSLEPSTLEDEPFAYKQTQTPRVIPEGDPLLSPNAELGKLAFEALGSGDPVSDPIIVSAIAAYVKSKEDDYDGWVLVNYPIIYSQASELEFTLMGYRTLPILEIMYSLEDVEGFRYRGSWAEPFTRDEFGSRRKSRLVPQPDLFVTASVVIPKTYFHAFIKLKKIPETARDSAKDSELYSGPMEKFYTDQEILLDFEYENLDFQTVKNLGKAILKNDRDSVAEAICKTSVEYFGDAVLDLNEKWEPKKKTAENTKNRKFGETKKVAKKSVSPTSFEVKEEPEIEEEEEEEEEEEQEEEADGKSMHEPHEAPRPGEPGWEWAEGPQPEEYLIALAGLWENMEAVYLEDFKNVFFCLRVHRANVLNYSKGIRQSIQTLMRRPDEKQKVLSDFQQMFNFLDPDIRPDVDIKCELHVRVSELEEALMNMADERKANSQLDMMKVAQDGWVPDEMASLTNIYLTALQLEADRCVDSLQVIMDYYTLLQEKIPDEKTLEKVVVPKLVAQDRKYMVSTGANKSVGTVSSKTIDLKHGRLEQSKERITKTRSLIDKRKRSSDGSILTDAAEVITQILTSLTLPEGCLTPFHNFFIETVEIVSTDVKNLLEGCQAEFRKSDKAPPNPGKGGKNGKKASDPKLVVSASGNLFAEWSTALENEMSRFYFRARLLLARGIFEMNEFLTTILNILSSLSDDITDMYMREIKSISECCKVFRCSIEEEKGIPVMLELKEDKFIVHMDVVLLEAEEEVIPVEENFQIKFLFSVEQLSLLQSKLQVVAPEGEIIKRSFLYIMEDLKSLNQELPGSNIFSYRWDNIEFDILPTVIDQIYPNLEIIHWKDFIIYGLELPVPTEKEILNSRKDFRKFDPCVTELISRDCYENVKLWFENLLTHSSLADRYEKAKCLLFDMYQVNESQMNYSALLLAFCKDEDPVNGFVKALTLAQGKTINKGTSEGALMTEENEGEYYYEEVESGTTTPSWEPTVKHCCKKGTSMTCIPKNRRTCTCLDSDKEVDMEGEEGGGRIAEQGGEYDSFFLDSPFKSGLSFVPFDVIVSILKASFPSLSQLSVLLDCSQTFQDTLNSIYDSLEPIRGRVEVGRLIRHKFIDRLLHSTNKFKYMSLRAILQDDFVSRSKIAPCSSDRLNISKCFK